MIVRVTVELDFGAKMVEITNVAQVVRHRAERSDGVFFYTSPDDRGPTGRIVAAWEIEKRHVPTTEPTR
jgi:hypothetical protein